MIFQSVTPMTLNPNAAPFIPTWSRQAAPIVPVKSVVKQQQPSMKPSATSDNRLSEIEWPSLKLTVSASSSSEQHQPQMTSYASAIKSMKPALRSGVPSVAGKRPAGVLPIPPPLQPQLLNTRKKTKKADITLGGFIESQLKQLSLSDTGKATAYNPQSLAAMAVVRTAKPVSMATAAATSSARANVKHRGKKSEVVRKRKPTKLKRHILLDRSTKAATPVFQKKQEPIVAPVPPPPEYRALPKQVRLVLERSPQLLTDRSLVREYCVQMIANDLDNVVTKVLNDLIRFQQRMRQNNPTNAKSRRRLMYGLREVLGQARLGKLKAIVVAKNIEASIHNGGLDAKLYDIFEAARLHETPVVFALSRRNLGEALKQKVPVSVVGIARGDGAEQDLAKMVELSKPLKQQWIDAFCKFPDVANGFGELPLHVAALFGHIECVEALLLARPSTLNATTTTGGRNATPLILAAERGHANILTFLLSKGADTTIADKNGHVAIDCAYIHRHRRCVALLSPLFPARDLKRLVQVDTYQDDGGDEQSDIPMNDGFSNDADSAPSSAGPQNKKEEEEEN